MSKKPFITGEELPFAELIIKPGDSRPIIIRLDKMGGDTEMSAGTAQDTVEAAVVLSLMQAVVRALGITRQMHETFAPSETQSPSGSDDIPF